MERYVPEPKQRKRITAAFMAFIFGTFGVHKFYLGNKGAGVFFVMLFVMSINILGFPLSALLGIIDGMKLLNMSDEEFDHRYNTNSVRTGQSYGRNRRNKRRHTREQPDFRRKRSNRTQSAQPKQQRRKAKSGHLRKENAYVKTGIQKYKDFDLDDAIIDFNKGLEIDPYNVALHFNIACAYSLTEQKKKAFEHLSKAVENGLKDIKKINTHEDLAFVRIQKEFADFKANGYQLTATQQRTSSTKKTTTRNTSNPKPTDDLLSRLNKLAELRKRGLLSDKEFLMEKEKLMG